MQKHHWYFFCNKQWEITRILCILQSSMEIQELLLSSGDRFYCFDIQESLFIARFQARSLDDKMTSFQQEAILHYFRWQMLLKPFLCCWKLMIVLLFQGPLWVFAKRELNLIAFCSLCFSYVFVDTAIVLRLDRNPVHDTEKQPQKKKIIIKCFR